MVCRRVGVMTTDPIEVFYDDGAHKLMSENRTRYFAMSALTGIEMRDGGSAPLLSFDQARDVIRWANQGINNGNK